MTTTRTCITVLLVLWGAASGQQWDPIPDPMAVGYEPDLAMDPQGNVCVVFLGGNDPWDARYVRYDASSGTWGDVVVIPGSDDLWELFGRPKLDVGPDGIPHVVWSGYDLGYLVHAHATSPAGTNWIVNHIYVAWCAFPDVAVDDQNNPHFAFQRIDAAGGTGWHLIYRDGAGNEVDVYSSADEAYKPNQPAVACSPGLVHVAWQQSDGDRGNAYYANSSDWNQIEQLSFTPYMWSASQPHLVVSPTSGKPGVVFFVDDWASGGYHRGAYYSEPGGPYEVELWTCFAQLPEESYPWNNDYYPLVGFDATGTRHVVWTVHDYGKTYYRIADNPVVELNGAGQIGIASGSAGTVMARRNPNAGGHLYWAQFTTSFQPPTATIVSISPNPASQGEDVIHFDGTAWDNDEGGQSITAYEWRSNVDGILANIEDFDLAADSLSPGLHLITLEVWDNEGQTDDTTAALTVLPPTTFDPTAAIVGLTPSTAYQTWGAAGGEPDTIVFFGAAWDNDEEGDSIVAREWVSSLDGTLASQDTFWIPADSLSWGAHVITYRVWDDEGQTDDTTATLAVVQPPPGGVVCTYDGEVDRVTLAWSWSPLLCTFNVYHDSVPYFEPSDPLAGGVPASPWYHENPGLEGRHYYLVTSQSSVGESRPSNRVGLFPIETQVESDTR